ncbi:hypothetical protein [Clostridium psychrophilum]|nr:hypothetical protein [Clostridium psychrophilum]
MTTDEMAAEYVKERMAKERMAKYKKSESDKAKILRYINWLYNLR